MKAILIRLPEKDAQLLDKLCAEMNVKRPTIITWALRHMKTSLNMDHGLYLQIPAMRD